LLVKQTCHLAAELTVEPDDKTTKWSVRRVYLHQLFLLQASRIQAINAS